MANHSRLRRIDSPATAGHFPPGLSSPAGRMEVPFSTSSEHGMSIDFYVSLSTAHLTQATACGFTSYPVLATTDAGSFVRVIDPDVSHEGPRRIPDDLAAVLRHAMALGVTLLHFDADADQLAGLPVFNW